MEVTREIVFPDSPDEVWRALTEAEQLEEWFANDVELDPREGGDGVFRWDDGEERRAKVLVAEPGERLVLDWDDRAKWSSLSRRSTKAPACSCASPRPSSRPHSSCGRWL